MSEKLKQELRRKLYSKTKGAMEQSDLELLKDIPGFKAILRAVIRSQMKHLVRARVYKEHL